MGQGQEQARPAHPLARALPPCPPCVRDERLSPFTEAIAPDAPLEDAARRLIALNRDRLPDLSGLVVLLPTLHAAAPFARALVAAAGVPTLLLPRFTTLARWVMEVPLATPQLSQLARQALLYGALRERGWLGEQDAWPLVRELVELFDALTLNRVTLPETPETFAQRLAEACGARQGPSLQLEARLVHELWQTMNAVLPDRVDAAGAYVQRLAALSRDARHPVFAVGLGRLEPVEAECLLRLAERQSVRILVPAPLDPEGGALQRVLAAAWDEHGETLMERARRLARDLPVSPLAGRLRLCGAPSLEHAAQAAALQVCRWLNAGRGNIAIVAQDRLAARRLRALLERSGVLVADETGWTLSTAAAATVLMRWLDLLASDFHFRELLDFLKSPLVFTDLAPGERREAVYGLEELIRRHNLVSRLSHYQAAARRENLPCAGLLDRLERARRLWPQQPQPLARWFGALEETLEALAITPALAADLAGAQLLAELARLKEEAATAPGSFSLTEWRRLLDAELEAATFRDTTIESPVLFTHLAATRLRRFEGVILLGCGAGELPAPGGGTLFNQAMRAELGLPTRAQSLADQLHDLAALLCASGEILAIWQRHRDGGERLLSPWLDALSTLHTLAWGEGLEATGLLPAPLPAPPASGTERPAPTLPPSRVPASISASGHNSLLACPYQYFARHVLHLNETDEVREEMAKKDYGDDLHRILNIFHARHKRVSDLAPEAAEAALRAITEEVFAPRLRLSYLSHAWKLQWERLIPVYLEWQRAWEEKEGWTFSGSEVPAQTELALEGGRIVTLVGRLDRLDVSEQGLAVIDYKTTSRNSLQKRLREPGEDVQLPVYALLAGPRVVRAAYLSLGNEDGFGPVQPAREIKEEAAAVMARLVRIFNALNAGAPLPAQGDEQACRHCEMQGLCRRHYWREEA